LYPATAFLPVVTWSVIATITGLVALRLAASGRFLVVPFLVFACLALFGGIVGHHYSLLVGIGAIARASEVRWIRRPGDPGDEEKLPVWSRVP
jgi:hypothetical protein